MHNAGRPRRWWNEGVVYNLESSIMIFTLPDDIWRKSEKVKSDEFAVEIPEGLVEGYLRRYYP